MPNPAWVPIVGRDFGDVGNQIYNWSNFNRGVEENNIGRMNQRDAQTRDYFANLAAIERAKQERQQQIALAMDQQRREDTLRQAHDKAVQYQFAQQMEMEKQRLAQNGSQIEAARSGRVADVAEKERNNRVNQVYQFSSSGIPIDNQPKELTAALSPTEVATAKTYHSVFNQDKERKIKFEQDKVEYANRVVNAERIKRGMNDWLLTKAGKASAKLTPDAQRAAYLATHPVLPKLDDTELQSIETKHKFNRLALENFNWDGDTQQYIFGADKTALDKPESAPASAPVVPASAVTVWKRDANGNLYNATATRP